jgi:phage portal protein BeeE
VRLVDLAFAEGKLRALRRTLEEPNDVDSFRTLIEQVIEDALTGGYGAIEMEPTGDGERPAMLWAVDGASIRINPRWDGQRDSARYAQALPGQLGSSAIELRDDQLMYVRMNPRSFTPFGLGPLEVAFETVNQFLSAHRFAGKLAANTVAQYALWLNEATPAQHDRLIRWWQDEIEGTGRVPLISTEQKPEVLRFAQGTDADLRLEWQEFLIRMVANAFGLPPMLLGLEGDVNRSTASEMADEAFHGAISPLALLLAGHITRDLFGKCIGWREFEFVFNDLNARDEETELAVQVQLLKAGVLTVDEVRAMRGLGPLRQDGTAQLTGEGTEAGTRD